MYNSNEKAQNYPSGIKSWLRDKFARLRLGKTNAFPVSRAALTAFVTGNISVSKYWDHKIKDRDLCRRWEECARTLENAMPTLTTSGYLDQTENTITAIKDVARIVKIRGDNEIAAFLIPTTTLAALVRTTIPLKLLGEAITKQDRKAESAASLRYETLHYKVRPLFSGIYDRYRSRESTPKEMLEYAVIPVLEDLGIGETAVNPVAQAWERLGHMAEDAHRKYGDNHINNTSSLNEHISLAISICESKASGSKNIAIPHYVIKSLCNTWRQQAFSGPSEEILAKAAENINFHLDPLFYLVENATQPHRDAEP